MLRCEDISPALGFRHLSEIRGIRYELRYAGSNNFCGRTLYQNLDCAWLREPAAAGLEQAAQWLNEQHPGYTLLVLDALRPQRVQEAIWRDVSNTPMSRYFADPVRGSIHSFGMAVDVTLINPDGMECDMGAGFDEMTERSHPKLEPQHLSRGLLTADHLSARRRLYAAMAEGGYRGIDTEWWHFDHGDREQVRREMQRVM